MQRIDMIIGGIVTAAILFSVLGVATYEREGPRSSTFEVVWTTSTRDLASQSQQQVGNGERTFSFNMNAPNLTNVAFEVRVTGNLATRPQVANIRVDVTPVNATAKSQTSSLPQAPAQTSTVTVPVEISLRPVPNATTVAATSNATAHQELEKENNKTLGHGTWTVKVTISNSGGPMGVGSETFTIAVSPKISTFSASVRPFVPDINR